MAKQPAQKIPPYLIKTMTVRSFDGGLDLVDDEIGLNPKFATKLDNMVRAEDGSMRVRYGYRLWADKNASGSVVPGNIIAATFYNNYLIFATDAGQLGMIDVVTKALTNIWNSTLAAALPGHPAGWDNPTKLVNFFLYAGKLIAMNGQNKPLRIITDGSATPVCAYYQNDASSTNAYIPISKYGIAIAGYAVLGGEPKQTGPTANPYNIDISTFGAASIYSTDPSNADGVQLDMSKFSPAIDSSVKGLATLRNKLIIASRTAVTVGSLGIHNASGAHTPDLGDSIAEVGTNTGRSMVTIGNDLFMCDNIGVPVLSVSSYGQFVPTRVSQLVEPMLQKNISRLTIDTLEQKCFAVYNIRDRQYMLFMPKFANIAQPFEDDPFSFDAQNAHTMVVHLANHDFDVGDGLQFTGSTAIGANPAALINQTFTVDTIIDANYFTVQLPTPWIDASVAGGGRACTWTPLTTETICYVFTYNPQLGVKAWSRFRNFRAAFATADPYGRVFFGLGNKIYVYGSADDQIFGDKLYDYDFVYSSGMSVTTGDVVLDPESGESYQALQTYTLAAATHFSDARAANQAAWTIWKGLAINFEWELPWGDFGSRFNTKKIVSHHIDAQGSGQFDFEIYIDELYKDIRTGQRTPKRSMTMTAGRGGYGAGTQPYGGGRRAASELQWPMPTLCKLYKLAFRGSTVDPLRVVSITLSYLQGSPKR